MIPAYPKIFAIGTVYIQDIFDSEVEVTEKIDGSQFTFSKINGEIQMRSKESELFGVMPNHMFNEVMGYIQSIQDKIPEGFIFHGEYLRKPKHNVLAYERIPKNYLMLFGVRDITQKMYPYGYVCNMAKVLGVEVVPLIFKGIVRNVDELLAFLDMKSILGNTNIEGVVVKNYNKTVLIGGMVMPIMAGKFVSEAFKEKHKLDWKEGSGINKIEAFMQSFRTEARWEKAVQHLRDNGQLLNEPKDIGNLIKEIHRDINEEEEDAIKFFLYKEFKPQIERVATAGFPEWYKKKLLENAFYA